MALFRRGGEVFAIGNACPHQGGSLCDGMVEGDIVICPLHGWEFDLRSGACMTVPGESVAAVHRDGGGRRRPSRGGIVSTPRPDSVPLEHKATSPRVDRLLRPDDLGLEDARDRHERQR